MRFTVLALVAAVISAEDSSCDETTLLQVSKSNVKIKKQGRGQDCDQVEQDCFDRCLGDDEQELDDYSEGCMAGCDVALSAMNCPTQEDADLIQLGMGEDAASLQPQCREDCSSYCATHHPNKNGHCRAAISRRRRNRDYCVCLPPAPTEPPSCCEAMTASCLSCQQGIDEEEFCASNPGQYDCPAPHELFPGFEPPNVGACRTADGDAGLGMYSRADHVDTVAQCASECDASMNCFAFEFGGVISGNPSCELHIQPMPAAQATPNGLCYNRILTGPVIAGYGPANFGVCRTADGGGGSYSRARHVDTVAQCASACDASTTCVAFEFTGFIRGNPSCELHRQPMPAIQATRNGLCYNSLQ